MNYKQFQNKIILRLDPNEEIIASIKTVCDENDIKLGSITGLWASNNIKIALFDSSDKKYYSKDFIWAYEIASLIWNISTMNDEVYLHCHITIGDTEHKTFSGHLVSAVISVTAEIIIDIIDGKVNREFKEEIGLNLLKI